MTKITEKRITELLNEESAIENQTLKNAIARRDEAAAKEREDAILCICRFSKRIMSQELKSLMDVREQERLQVERVTLVDTATKEFTTDGDFKKFKATLLVIGLIIK